MPTRALAYNIAENPTTTSTLFQFQLFPQNTSQVFTVFVLTAPGSGNTDPILYANIFYNVSIYQCKCTCRLQIAFPTVKFYDNPLFLASTNELLHIMWCQEMQRHLEQKPGGHEEDLLLRYSFPIKAERNGFFTN